MHTSIECIASSLLVLGDQHVAQYFCEEACPVTAGEKWAIVIFYKAREQVQIMTTIGTLDTVSDWMLVSSKSSLYQQSAH